MEKNPCNGHSKGDGSWWLKDARGIEVGRVCDSCEDVVKSKFRPEIFEDANYGTTEDIEEES